VLWIRLVSQVYAELWEELWTAPIIAVECKCWVDL
jgi:hypothetical protein